MTTDDRVDDLYALPLEEFTQARNALAKELKDAGDKGAAHAVKKLVKPTLAAWIVNQLARREPDLMQELISVQDRLAAASSPAGLRELTRTRRELVTSMKRAAEGVLAETGHSTGSATMQQVSQTLLAGATADEQDLLLQGRLTRDLSSSGLEQVWGLDPSEISDQEEDEDELGRKAKEEAEELTKQAAEAHQRAGGLTAEVERLRDALADAETAASDARKGAEELEDRAASARRDAGLAG